VARKKFTGGKECGTFGPVKDVTLGDKLGLASKTSPLLEKAKAMGLSSGESLEALGVGRGCSHYSIPGKDAAPDIPESAFGNEELAIALLSPELPYSPRGIRIAACMMGSVGNQPVSLVELAIKERAIEPVRYIATSALTFEPENSFWHEILELLPPCRLSEVGVMPHPTRFVSMTGMTRNGVEKVTVWLRPRRDLVPLHG
jgi:hypothetical protein